MAAQSKSKSMEKALKWMSIFLFMSRDESVKSEKTKEKLAAPKYYDRRCENNCSKR